MSSKIIKKQISPSITIEEYDTTPDSSNKHNGSLEPPCESRRGGNSLIKPGSIHYPLPMKPPTTDVQTAGPTQQDSSAPSPFGTSQSPKQVEVKRATTIYKVMQRMNDCSRLVRERLATQAPQERQQCLTANEMIESFPLANLLEYVDDE